MNRDSNFYTFIFASVMVLIIALLLSFTATSLKELQNDNVRKEKMQNILSTIGINTTRDEAEVLYKKYIKKEVSVTFSGEENDQINAFDIELNKEIKKNVEKQIFPLYIAEVENEIFYIIPLYGSGLWNAIWGYIALKSNKNTIKGVIFDHFGETAGLGAEITTKWFQDSFVDEKIFDSQGNLVGVYVSKTNNDPTGLDKNDNEVDAISGATITGDGVTEMITERLQHYLNYFNKI